MAASSATGTGIGSAQKSFTQLLNGVVKSGNLSSDAVSTAKIADTSITAAKLKYFKSAEITGNGSAQNTAHGLGVAPALVFVYPTELAADLTAGYDVVEGTHTSTNCVVTVTTGQKYRIVAIA